MEFLGYHEEMNSLRPPLRWVFLKSLLMMKNEEYPLQGPISIHLTMEKFQSCLQQDHNEGYCPEFLFVLKDSPLQHLASWFCVPSCNPLQVWSHGHGPCVCLWPHGSLAHRANAGHRTRENKNKQARESKWRTREQEPGRVRELFGDFTLQDFMCLH